MIEIAISNNQNALNINEADIKRTVDYVLNQQNIQNAAVSLAFVTDEIISDIKKKYFGREEATDVISFDLSEKTEEKTKELDCEIIVNPQCALRQANLHNTDPNGELHLYIVHGLLHQLGYDDSDQQQAQTMHKREDQLLEGLGFGQVYNRGGGDKKSG